jgi:hypothetical protein
MKRPTASRTIVTKRIRAAVEWGGGARRTAAGPQPDVGEIRNPRTPVHHTARQGGGGGGVGPPKDQPHKSLSRAGQPRWPCPLPIASPHLRSPDPQAALRVHTHEGALAGRAGGGARGGLQRSCRTFLRLGAVVATGVPLGAAHGTTGIRVSAPRPTLLSPGTPASRMCWVMPRGPWLQCAEGVLNTRCWKARGREGGRCGFSAG